VEAAVPGPVPRYEIAEWRTRYGVVAGITGRGNGPAPFDLGLAGVAAPVGEVIPRWHQLLRAVPGMEAVLVSKQVHGTDVRWHDQGRGLVLFEGFDGHATDAPGLLLAVTAADCVPVYLVDPVRRAVALVHAGWRGTAGGIVPRAIDLLVKRGSRVENLLVHCGVGICGECYEVGPEVFAGCGVPAPTGGKGPLDLRAVLADQAKRASVETISTSHFCSSHHADRFFSHRAAAGADGRMVAYLGLLPENV
jgi:polyphenol oxidase